jgi:hypothetical protein
MRSGPSRHRLRRGGQGFRVRWTPQWSGCGRPTLVEQGRAQLTRKDLLTTGAHGNHICDPDGFGHGFALTRPCHSLPLPFAL